MTKGEPHLQFPVLRIAVMSDTHGLLRPQVMAAVTGADHILHAGDVGDPAILTELRTIAPLTAIRGNIDTKEPCSLLPHTEMVEIGGATLYLVHSIADLGINPASAGVHAVLYGHSHRPAERIHNGVLYLNPGSVGPRRFNLPIAMAFLNLYDGKLHVETRVFDL